MCQEDRGIQETPNEPSQPKHAGPSFGPHASVTPEPIASHQRVLACTGPAGDPRTGQQSAAKQPI